MLENRSSTHEVSTLYRCSLYTYYPRNSLLYILYLHERNKIMVKKQYKFLKAHLAAVLWQCLAARCCSLAAAS